MLLNLFNLFDHDIMVTRNATSTIFFFNDGDIGFGELKDPVCLNMEIPEILTWSSLDHLLWFVAVNFCSILYSYFLHRHQWRWEVTL